MSNTLVIYRKFTSDGQVVAVFPEEAWSRTTDSVSSYMHIGQHGAAGLFLLGDTRDVVAATPEEYADLHRELIGQGYDDLAVVTLDDSRAFKNERIVMGFYDDNDFDDGESTYYVKVIGKVFA